MAPITIVPNAASRKPQALGARHFTKLLRNAGGRSALSKRSDKQLRYWNRLAFSAMAKSDRAYRFGRNVVPLMPAITPAGPPRPDGAADERIRSLPSILLRF